MNFIKLDWDTPPQIHALMSTRLGGVSQPPYDTFNLAEHVGDKPEYVAQNRRLLRAHLPSEPLWLKQIHSSIVSIPTLRTNQPNLPIVADAIVTTKSDEVLVIMTADCLPVLFAANDGSVIGAAHAGWRGLSSGVLENTVDAMLSLSPHLSSTELLAYMGPAIGPSIYEVGEDVFETFQESSIKPNENDFVAIPNKNGKYLVNLYSLAKARLKLMGINRVDGGGSCTYLDQDRFFSYRRDGTTGRFACFIWIEK
ncbi:MAG: peptidoglycan editing factor PgeF [Betaproteobacteria bacterium]|nr:peptidoglycan editing factor PgeF [Betaproteobacteria bacterium]